MLNLGAKRKVIISLRTVTDPTTLNGVCDCIPTACQKSCTEYMPALSFYLVCLFLSGIMYKKTFVSEKGVSASIWPRTNHQTKKHTAMTSKLQLHLPLSQPTIFISPASHVVLSQCGGYMVVSQFPLHSHTCTRTHIHIGQGSLSSFPSSSFCP